MLPNQLLTLMAYFKKLPGVGAKTAERFAFQILSWPPDQLKAFAAELAELKEKITTCATCGCLKDQGPCPFCDPTRRDDQLLCLVSSPKDVYALEETRAYKGLYHVLGGLLSPLQGRGVEAIDFPKLLKRLQELKPAEVIIALDSTIEGDATSLYLKQELEKWGIKTSRLAFGLPMGSSLDFVDYGTLERALKGRISF